MSMLCISSLFGLPSPLAYMQTTKKRKHSIRCQSNCIINTIDQHIKYWSKPASKPSNPFVARKPKPVSWLKPKPVLTNGLRPKSQTIARTTRRKYHHIARLAQLIMSLPHSNTDEERVFSRINKTITKFRGSLSEHCTVPSILSFQMNRPADQPCFGYNPNERVCKKARKVMWEYC